LPITSIYLAACHANIPNPHSFPTRRSSDLHISLRRRDVATREPGNHAGDEQYRVRRGECEQGVAQGVDHHSGEQDGSAADPIRRSEEHTSELQSHLNLVCRLLLEKKNNKK